MSRSRENSEHLSRAFWFSEFLSKTVDFTRTIVVGQKIRSSSQSSPYPPLHKDEMRNPSKLDQCREDGQSRTSHDILKHSESLTIA